MLGLHPSKMRVKCRLTRAPRVESGGQQDHTLASMFFGERIKVLTVGDDPASLADLEVHLSREGFEATGVVYAGGDPQVAVSSRGPDVILIYLTGPRRHRGARTRRAPRSRAAHPTR